jgi:rubrerythrin
MTLQQRLTVRFLTHLVATPAGRAHVLHQAAEAESNGETQLFDRLQEHVDDPELGRLVKRHAEDEVRHAELFRACVARTGVTPPPVPPELRVIDRLDAALGGVFQRPIRERRDVMNAYLLLQVLEERAVTQFGVMEPVFRAVDPETADVFAQIASDEQRHLRYCHAIARRYSPDVPTQAEALSRFRAIEAKVYAGVTGENVRHTLARGLITPSPLEHAGWLALDKLGRLVGREQRTPFWGQPPVVAARALEVQAPVALAA